MWVATKFVRAAGLVAATLIVCAFSACQSDDMGPSSFDVDAMPPDDVGDSADVEAPQDSPDANGQFWGDRIVSEAYYTLSQTRSGGSSKSYKDTRGRTWTMADWNWAQTDRDSDGHVSYYIGCRDGATCDYYRGNTGYMDGYYRGGECKFFANSVLYRSSYGWGNSDHLVTPSGYTYANRDVRDAEAGWVLQKNSPGQHTAIVVYKYAGGLDVVDSNYIGQDRGHKHWIARHLMTWSELSGYKAWCPWENPKLLNESAKTQRCY